MQPFSKRILVEKHYRSFYFNPTDDVQGSYFHIAVIDTDKNVQVVKMREQHGSWRLANRLTCPLWIVGLEPTLEKAVLESLKKQNVTHPNP